MVSGKGGTAQHSHLFRVHLAFWWHGSVAFGLEVSSRCLVFQVTVFGGNWHNETGHKLKFWIKVHKLGTKALARNEETTGFVLFLFHGEWDPIYPPPMGSLASMGMLPTWEKVVTYLSEPLGWGNLRDSHKPSQLPLLNQTFGILPLCFGSSQGCKKCDRLHRDAMWIGGLSHQSSNLSHLCYSLQKVVVYACSNTEFKQHKVVNYLANLQTT